MANKITFPIGYYPDPTKGKPLAGGQLYIGEVDLDPITNQKTITALQENGSQVAISQPVTLSAGGTPEYNGSPVTLYVAGDYSMKVLDKNDSQVYYIPNNTLTEAGEIRIFGTVADMIAASLIVGNMYITQGYDTAGDDKGANYFIKTAAEYGSTPNEISDFTVNTDDVAVLQEGLASSGKHYDISAGAVNLQAAIDDIENSTSGAVLDCSYETVNLLTGVNHDKGDSGLRNIDITLDGAFSSAATDEAALRGAVGLRRTYNNISIECNGNGNGLWNETFGYWNQYHHIEINDFVNFGLKIQGSADQQISNSLITGTATVANRVGNGININTADVKLFNTVSRYSFKPLSLSGNTLHATGNHFYNGDAGGATPATNSTNIKIDSGSGGTFCHTYLDKGRVEMEDSFSHGFFDTKLLFDATPQHSSVFNWITSTVDDEWPEEFVFDGAYSTSPLNDGSMQFLTLNTSGSGTWVSSVSSIKDEINLRYNGVPKINMKETSSVVPAGRTEITPGDTITHMRSFGVNTYANNTTIGVIEKWQSQYHALESAGIVNMVKATGTLTTGTKQVEGSRTGVSTVSRTMLRDRKGAVDWDDTNGAMWSFDLVGSAGNDDTLDVVGKSAGTTTETTYYQFSIIDFRAATDNVYNLGSGALRWGTVYAGTGSINTSDARLKTDIRGISDAERNVALSIKSMMKAFRFNDAVEIKGEDARIHFGVIAQDVGDAFTAEGLDPLKYGMFCYDEWDEIVNDDGEIVLESGNRYGIRYDELMCFIIASM